MSAVEFHLGIDETLLSCDSTDADGDGLSDSIEIVVSTPMAFIGAECDMSRPDEEVAVGLVSDPYGTQIPDGTLAEVTLDTSDPGEPTAAAIVFSKAQFVSGTTEVAGAHNGSVIIFCPDFTGDPGAGTEELDALADNWRQDYPSGDCDVDSIISVQDLMCVSSAWGETCPAPADSN